MLDGFGGVSEYGITVRWDKNFLTLLHLTLARRDTLRIYGGIRFGGTLPIEDAWAHGFDHIAIAAGAGKPTVIDMKNNLVRGIRKASDFLMALQLTGAFKRNALPNLQARLPAIVIGGGLTGIDTATELFAYYPVQVEKTLERYEALCAEQRRGRRCAPPATPRSRRSSTSSSTHGRAVRAERARAAAAGEAPDFVPLVRGWGGVTLAYRKQMTDSPAYRLNHEEVIKALEEGIRFAESLDPKEIVADDRDHVVAHASRRPERQRRAARAHGARRRRHVARTSPTRRRSPGTFQLDSKRRFFQGFRAERVNGAVTLTPDPAGFFTSLQRRRPADLVLRRQPPALRRQRRQGDGLGQGRLPPRDGALRRRDRRALDPAAQPARDAAWARLVGTLDTRAAGRRVERVERLTPTIVEVVVKAPAAARHFQPGPVLPAAELRGARRPREVAGRAAAPDGGHRADRRVGRPGAGAALDDRARDGRVEPADARTCKPGEPVVVMGPTGTPTEIPHGETVLLAGGGLGNAVLFSIAKALKEQRQHGHLLRRLQEGRGPLQARGDRGVHRPGDLEHRHRAPRSRRAGRRTAHFRGNIVQAMVAYANGELGTPLVPHRHRVAHHRHRLGPDDGGGEGRAPRRAGAAPAARPRRHRQHQLADAVHDEGGLRAVPAEARGPGHRPRGVHLLVLQPGPGDGPGGLPEPQRAAAAEHGAGEALEPVARSPARDIDLRTCRARG